MLTPYLINRQQFFKLMRVTRLFDLSEEIHMVTKERLAAMAASLCAVCSGPMVTRLVKADPENSALELRTYVCSECGHSRTYSVDGGDI